MKRFLSLALTLILLCTAVVQVSASETSGTRNINENLTIHYDFEGENYTEALKDKATAGKTKDDLTAYAAAGTFNNTFLLHTEKGTVETKKRDDMETVNNSLSTIESGDSLPTADSDTYEANTGEGTWFIRFRLNEETTSAVTLIEFRNNNIVSTGASRPLYLYYDGSDGKLGLTIANSNNGSAMKIALPAAYDFTTSPWLNVALVRKATTKTGYTHYYDVFVAYGNPTTEEDWKTGNTDNGRSARAWVTSLADATGVPLCLYSQGAAYKPGGNIEIDDVRYYNVALTTAELGTIGQELSRVNLLGFQTSMAYTDGNNNRVYDIRMIAEIDKETDSSVYSELGFVLSATVAGSETPITLDGKVSTVFTSLQARTNDGAELIELTASEGKYLMAITVKGIPEDVLPTFTVTPYLKLNASTYATYDNSIFTEYDATATFDSNGPYVAPSDSNQ